MAMVLHQTLMVYSPMELPLSLQVVRLMMRLSQLMNSMFLLHH